MFTGFIEGYAAEIITFIAVMGVVGILWRRPKRAPISLSDLPVTLGYPKSVERLGWLILILSLYIALMAIALRHTPLDQRLEWLLLPVGFSLLCVPLILYGQNSQIQISANALLHCNALKKSTQLRWSEIKTVSFSPTHLEMTMEGAQGKVVAHLYLENFQLLVEAVKYYLPEQITQQALSALKDTRKLRLKS